MKLFKNNRLQCLFIGAACVGAVLQAGAAYPERPIRMIVPSTPGGGADLATRIVMPKLGELLGQSSQPIAVAPVGTLARNSVRVRRPVAIR